MNNVFRLIWNRTLGRLVVASEAARSQHKAGNGSKQVGQPPIPVQKTTECRLFTPLKPKALLLACATMLLLPLGISDAEARKFASDGGSCVSVGGGTVIGRLVTPSTTFDPIDGSGTYSTVAGCNASGNGQSAATVYGTFSQVTGAGGAAFGFNVRAARWATAIGLESRATGVSGTALGFGSQATALNAVAIGGAGGDGTTPLAVADSTLASGLHSIAIGSNAVRGAQALGGNAIAIGGETIASELSSTALGNKSQATGASSLAVGERSEATAQFANALGIQSKAEGLASLAVGPAAKALAESSVAMGRRSEATELQSIAVGFDSKASGVDSLAIGTGAIASGERSISIGFANEVSGTGSGAIGDPNIITGAGSYALGNDNTIEANNAGVFGNRNILAATADGSRIIGNDNNINVPDAMVVGNNADVTQAGGVALGSGSVADTAAGIVGYVPFGATAADTAAINGTVATQAAVDIGSRQITSVAAGTELDDAVNVSQLVATQTSVAAGTNVTSVAESDNPNGGTIYTINADGASVSAGSAAVDVVAAVPDANNVTDYAVDLSQASKDSLTLADSALQDVVTQVDGVDVKTLTKGDNNANFVTGKNMALSPDGAGGIEIATLDNVTFTDVKTDTLTAGPVNIGATGIDAGNTTISGVAPGVAGTDAVNLNQLDDAAAASKTEVAGGTNVAGVDKATGINGQDIYTVNAEGASVSAGSAAVDVVAAAPDANNVTDYAVDLSQASKDSLTLADSALQDVVTQVDGVDVKTLTKGDNNANFVTGKNMALSPDGAGGIEIATLDNVTFTDVKTDTLTAGPVNIGATGIDAGNTTISGVAPGVAGTDAVNLNQLDDAAAASKTEVAGGSNIASVDKTTGINGQDIYTVNADGASVSAGSGAVDVVAAAPDANNVTDYAVDLSQASKDSLTLADSALQDVVTQVDGVDVKTLTKGDNNANFVTGKNMALSPDGAGGIEIATLDNVTFTDVKTDTLTAGPVNIGATGIDAGNTTISGVAPGVAGTDAVNLNQLDDAAAASKTEVAGGTNVAGVDKATGINGQDIYTVNADGASVSAGSGAVDVVAAAPDANNVTDYAVDLSQASKDSLTLADSALQDVVTQVDGVDVKTLTKGDNNANFVTGKNMALSPDGAGGIEIATLDNVTFTDVKTDTLTAGPVNIGATGIDAGNTAISGVAPGVAGTDAVNLNQLDDAAAASKTEVAGGTNVAGVDKATGINGQDIYTVNAEGASVSAGSAAVDVVAAVPDANNVTDYAVDLSQASKDSLTLADSALQDVVTQVDGVDVKTLTKGDNNANFVTGKNMALSPDGAGGIEIATLDNVTFTDVKTDTLTAGPVNIGATGIDAGNTTISGVAPGVAGTDAVNLNQLDDAAAASKTEVAGGTNVAGVDKATGINGQDIYTVNADGASVSAGSGAVDVVAAAPDANNVTDYAVDLSQASKDSLLLADSALQTVVTQIDGTAVKTIDQNDNVANFISGDNIELSDLGGAIEIATSPNLTADSLTINNGPTLNDNGIDMGGDTITNVGAPINGGDAVNLDYFDENRTRYYSVNDNGVQQGNYDNDGATGINALAAGTNALADGNSSLAMGDGARTASIGSDQVAVGTGALAGGNRSIAIGQGARAATDLFDGGIEAVAIGSGASAQGTGNVALGSGSFADGSTLATAAYQPLDSSGNPIAVAAPTATSEVSVGTVGDERRIINVAAGAEDTDAVNVSQLKAVNELASAGWDVQTNGDTATNVAPGDTVQFIDGKNIDITRNGADITVATADSVVFDDVTITGGPTLTGGGIDMNNTTISNLADGVNANDAVNLSQLEGAVAASKTEVAGGTNVAGVDKATGINGQDIYTVNAEGASVSAGSAAVDVVAAVPDANNVTDYAVDLSQASKDSLTLADSALQDVVTQVDGVDVKTLTKGDNNANFVTGKNMALSPDGAGGIEIATLDNVTFTDVKTDTLTAGPVNIGATGIDAGNTTISGVAPGVAGTDAVNLNQLDDAAAASKTEVAGGTNVAGVDKATGINGQDIYTVNAEGASVSAGSAAVDVVAAAPDANNVTDYAVDLSQASKDSLTLADSALQDVVTQVDGVDVKTLTKGDNNANFVTGKNMALSPDGAGGIEIATLDNVTFTDVKTDTLTAGPVNIGATGIDAGNTTISGVAPGVAGTDAVNLNQLDDAAAASKTEVAGGTNVAGVDKATGINGQDIYTVNAEGASVSAGSAAVDVVAAAPDANNVTDYAVDLSQASKDSLTLADSALQTVVTQIDGTAVKTIDQNDNVANFVTGKNMALSPDGAGGIEIATLDNVTFTDVKTDTLTAGPVNIGATGIDAGNTTISGVAPGVAGTDAVNLNQLDDAAAASKTEVAGGTNVAGVDKATGINGQDIYTVNAEGASVSAGSAAVDVVAAAPDANNVTDYAVDLSQASKDSLTLADSALQTVVTQIDGTAVKTIDQNDNVANFVTGKNMALSPDGAGGIEIATLDNVTFTDVKTDTLTAGPVNIGATGIDAGNTTISGVAPGVAGTDAVNLNQLDDAAAASKTEVAGGTNVAGVDKATGINGQDIYTVNAEGASVSAGSAAVDVVAAAPDANNVTDYAVDLSQASKDSLTLADSALQTVVTQIDGTAVKTIDQNDNVANFVTGKNMALSPDGAGGIEIATLDNVTFTDVKTDTLTAGPVNIGATGIDAGNTTISGVAPGVAGTDAVNLNQLDDAAAASKTEVAGGSNIASVDKTTGINGQDIYTVNADGASVSAGSSAVDVTAAAPDANNVTDYAVDLSQASKDSLTLADSALQTVVTQIDGAAVKTIDQNDNVANFVTGKNMALSPDGAGGIEIATLDNVTFTDVKTDTLTAGPVNIGATGIDAGNTTISGVAPGVAGTDAVNLNQLDDAAAASKTEVAGGSNIASVDKTTGINGQDIYTVNAEGASVSAGSGAVDVTAAAPDANNVTDYAVDLSQASKDSLTLADSALQTVVTQIDGTEVKTLDENDNVANFVTGDNIVLSDEAGGIKIATADDVTFTSINSDSLAITGGPTLTGGGIDMNGGTISDLAPGVNPQDAVNLSQLENSAAASKTEVAGGTNVASVDKATGVNGQDIYTVNAEGASVSAGSGAVDVTAAAPDANNVTDYAVDLSQASKDSLTLADSALQTVVTQIDGTEVKTLDENDNVANFVTGDNIVLSDEAGGIKIATADDVTFTSINSDSLAITGGPTLTGGGIDMNNTTISNLADGVNANDAVNLSQLEKVSSSANAGWNVTTSNETGTVSSNVGPNANVDFVSGDENVVISHMRSEDGSTSIDYRLADDVRIGNSVSVGDTSISNDGLVITGGPSVTTQGIDAGNKQITNAASGVGDTPLDELEGDALGNVINAGDLQNVANNLSSSVTAAKTEVEAGNNMTVADRIGDDGQVIYTVATADEVSFDQVDIGSVSINADNVDDSGNTIISGVGEGGIGEDSTDAINGSQLWATQDLIKNLEGGVINIAGDLSDEYITNNGRGIRYVRTNDEGLDVSDAFAEAQGSTALGYEARATGDRALAMGYEAMASHQGSVALGEGARTEAAMRTASVEIGGQTYQFAGVNPVATVSVGNAGSERTITNVAAGRISATSTDAINGSQLYASNQFMDTLDDRLTIVEGGLGDLTETVAGIPQGGGEGAVEYARNDDGSINKNTVELAGDGGSKITNVAPGEIASGSSDAVSGDQLHTTRQDVAGNTANIEGNRNQIAGNTDSISNINTTLDKGLNVSADQGEPVNRQLGDTVAVTGDNNITTRTTGQGVQVTLNRELNVNSVTTGNTTINNDGVRIQDGPSMTQTGFDANGTTITNVAPGVNAGDAVNVGQMNELGQRFANEINNVHGRIDKVERNANAGIAAVAAMGHAPYVPGKLTYHVGGGHHGGESAVGINFRRTADNGRWSLNAGIAGSRAGATIGVGISGVID